jgi:GNAT superfamily N-acetyltransferase
LDIRRLTPATAKGDPEFGALYARYLADFDADCDPSRYGPLLERLLGEDWIGGLVASGASSLLGFCIYSRTYSALTASPAYLVEDLYVDPPFRRGGVGLALIEELIGQARTAGARRIFVQTDLDDPSMTGFYSRIGFVDADASLLRLEV